jgi:hypothetical protein
VAVGAGVHVPLHVGRQGEGHGVEAIGKRMHVSPRRHPVGMERHRAAAMASHRSRVEER